MCFGRGPAVYTTLVGGRKPIGVSYKVFGRRRKNKDALLPFAGHKISHFPDMVFIKKSSKVLSTDCDSRKILPVKMPAVTKPENTERKFGQPAFAGGQLFNFLLTPKFNGFGHGSYSSARNSKKARSDFLRSCRQSPLSQRISKSCFSILARTCRLKARLSDSASGLQTVSLFIVSFLW